MNAEDFTSLQKVVEDVSTGIGNAQENIQETATFLDKFWDQIKEYLASAGINLIISLVILVIGWRLINICVNKFKKSK